MGLFRKKEQPEPAPAVTDKVYYSTPLGDTKDGGQQLFLLQREGVRHMPVRGWLIDQASKPE